MRNGQIFPERTQESGKPFRRQFNYEIDKNMELQQKYLQVKQQNNCAQPN